MEKVQSGDIVFFKHIPTQNVIIDNFINIYTKIEGIASHVEMIFDVVKNEKGNKILRTVGSSMDGVKLREWKIDIENMAIGRHIGLERYDNFCVRNIIWKYFRKTLETEKTQYDFLGLLTDAAANAILKKFVVGYSKSKKLSEDQIKKFQQDFEIWYENDNKICSEFVTEIIESFGCKITDEFGKTINNNVISPADLFKASEIRFIKRFSEDFQL